MQTLPRNPECRRAELIPDDPATAYARAVVAGTVPAGVLHRAACERHLRDLNRDSVYVWEPERGARFESFCGLLAHYKGAFAGKPFALQPFQQFISYSIFGWVHRDSGLRRFRTAVVRVPRKNGKTTWAAAVALYLLSLDGESGAEIYSAATKRDQAKIVWSDAKNMLARGNPSVRRRFVSMVNRIEFPLSASKFEPIAADSTKQDGLNPHAAICDETHAWPTRDLWDVLEDGMGARQQPLMLDISTAGSSQQCFSYENHKRAEDVLSGSLDDDGFFAFVAMADKGDAEDWQNPDVWAKANPGMGSIKSPEYMAEQAANVRATPSKLPTFLIKQLNLWTSAAERWLDVSRWVALGRPGLRTALAGAKCWGGLDLAKVNDLSALALIFPPDEVERCTGEVGKYALLTWHWCPADDIATRTRNHRVPYQTWERAGLIETTPGNATDYSVIRARILDILGEFQVEDIAFDRMFAGETVQALDEAGASMVAFGQGMVSMGQPTAEFERLTLSGGLIHEDSDLLKWEAGNVVVVRDSAGNIKPDKAHSREKIDGIVAAIMALARAQSGATGEFCEAFIA